MKNIVLFTIVCAFITLLSCNKKNAENTNLTGEIIKEWRILVKNDFINPSPANRSDTGELILQVTDRNNLTYQYNITGLQNSDFINGAGLYAGDPLTNGARLIDFAPRPSPAYGSRSIYNLRKSLVDSMLNSNVDLYFMATSTQHPTGLVRAQLNTTVVFAADLALSGLNEVPPVTTTATGLSSLRITSNRILYSKIVISNMEVNDMATMAHIHTGAPGANGPVIVPLVSAPAEFGIVRKFTLTEAQYNSVLKDRTYVNVHSTLFPAGKVRGQIR